VPFIVMERLPGRVFFVWDPHHSFARDKAGTESLWRQCVEAQPGIHRFDWRTHLKDWQAPEPLVEMITALWMARRVDDSTRRAILDRLPDEIDDHEAWRAALERTQDLRPPDPRPRWRTQYRADIDETGDDE
jgi:hypothetical protein